MNALGSQKWSTELISSVSAKRETNHDQDCVCMPSPVGPTGDGHQPRILFKHKIGCIECDCQKQI